MGLLYNPDFFIIVQGNILRLHMNVFLVHLTPVLLLCCIVDIVISGTDFPYCPFMKDLQLYFLGSKPTDKG
mgnify:FL=1